MNSSRIYHTRRQDVYPDASRDYSSRQSNRHRATSVGPYQARDYKPSYNVLFSQNYEVIRPVSHSKDYSSRPPIPHRQPTSYHSIPPTQSYYPSAPSMSSSRRTSGNLPRSSSTSRLVYSDLSPHHYSSHYSTAAPNHNHTYSNSKYVYAPTSSSSWYGHEPLTKRLDSSLSGSLTRLSMETPKNYNVNSIRKANGNYESYIEIRPRRPRQTEVVEVEQEKEEEEGNKEESRTKPKPGSHIRRGLDSTDSTYLPSSPEQGRRGTFSICEDNHNNMHSMRTSTSSSSSSEKYPPAASAIPRLHGGHSGFNSVSRSSSYGNAGLIGLANLGNTCFMNSVLQCLSNTSELLRICLDDVYTSELNGNSTMRGNLFSAYADLMRQMWSSTSSSVSYINPQRFRSQIQRYAPRFVGNSQQDAQEFLRYLVQGLHEDVNRVTHRPPTETPDYVAEDKMPDTKKAELYWQRYKRIDDSLVSDLFMGQLKSTLECLKCGHQSTTFDPFWDLSLPIPPMHKVNIEDCFNHFTSSEMLGGSEQPTCSGCKLRQPCQKRFFIQRFPKILVIHFKRFSGDRFGSKIRTFIDYPIDDLDLTRYASHSSSEVSARYRLYAVSNHIGDVFLGHYTACCRHPYLKSWHLYNDQSVREIDPHEAVSEQAYVLFYHRIH